MVLPGQDGLHEKKNILHPRPQLTRTRWIDLGGTWGFAYDDEMRGLDESQQECVDLCSEYLRW